jgi:prepilin-type N-terminal cleavage/methylation domain-containing protein
VPRQPFARMNRDESGFTLVELLVVVIILAILAAIVVFSVRGINDQSQTAACSADLRMLMTAEETHFADRGAWASTEQVLVDHGFLARPSSYYDIKPPVAPSTTYSLDRVGTTCPVPPAPA